MSKRLFAVFSAFALLLTACNGGQQPEGGGDESPAAGAQTYRVNVDGKSDRFNLATIAYFPNELSAHPGDTVEFREVFTGEPHTVTFGTLVDSALEAVDRARGGAGGGASPGAAPGGGESPTASPGSATASPGASPTARGSEQGTAPGEGAGGPPPGPPPPELQKLPDLFGPPPLFQPFNQSAGQPCFLDSGDPPVSPQGGAPACPKRDQPDFTGTQTFFNSGYLSEDETFSVKLSDDIRPGDYSFMCLIHRDMMRGKLTVAAPDAEIPSPREVEREGRQQLEQKEQALTSVHEGMQKASADKAMAGAGSPEVMDALVAEFGPKEVSVRAGDSVTWNVFFFHTISLNGPEDAVGDVVEQGDGTITPNPKAVTPSEAPNPPPIVLGPGGKPTTTQATWDGTGYFNSGPLAGFPGAEVTYRIRFTRPGTYQLQCNFHPDMEGTVRVT